MPKSFTAFLTFKDNPNGLADITVGFSPMPEDGDHSPALDLAVGIIDAIQSAKDESDGNEPEDGE